MLRLLRTKEFSPLGKTVSAENPSLVFDPQSRFVCCSGTNGQVELLVLPGLERLITFSPLQAEPILRVAISPNSELLATSTESGRLYLWRTGDGKLLESVEVLTAQVFGLDFDPWGRSLLSASYHGKALVWKIEQS